MTKNRILPTTIVVTAITGAAALGVAIGTSNNPDPVTTSTRSYAPCATVLVDNMSRAQVDVLTAAGWIGDPTDHQEKLYSPTCSVPRSHVKRHTPGCDPVYGGGMDISNLRPNQLTALTEDGWVIYQLSDTLRAAYAPGCSPN